MKVKEWLLIWLENYVQPTAKERTRLRYSEVVKHHLIPHIGELEMAEVTPLVLQQMVTGLTAHGNLRTGGALSANTVNVIITVIQSALRVAYQLGYIPEYTADRVRRPRAAEKGIECFTLKEQKKIEAAVLADRRPKMFGIVLSLYTGLRIGELIALQWKDIDLQKGLMAVSRSCHDTSGGIVFDEPKTATSRRVIPLPKQLLPKLKIIKKNSNSDFVVSMSGNAVSVRSYQRSFELLLRRQNIVHRGFHSLRHTFATRALECGMDVKTLSEILGHKNPTVTLNRYAHSLLEHKAAMMNRLGKLL